MESIKGKGNLTYVRQMKDVSMGLGARTQDVGHTKSIINVGVKMSWKAATQQTAIYVGSKWV